VEAARTAAVVTRAIIAAVLPAIRILPAALRAAIIALRLAAVLVARLVAVLSLLLPRAPLIERRAAGIALALAFVIAVMAPPRVGTKAHAHHQHRRKQHARCPPERPPRWSCNAHKHARGRPSVRLPRHALGAVPSPACGGGIRRGHAKR